MEKADLKIFLNYVLCTVLAEHRLLFWKFAITSSSSLFHFTRTTKKGGRVVDDSTPYPFNISFSLCIVH